MKTRTAHVHWYRVVQKNSRHRGNTGPLRGSFELVHVAIHSALPFASFESGASTGTRRLRYNDAVKVSLVFAINSRRADRGRDAKKPQ
jgi:hypothetical protein